MKKHGLFIYICILIGILGMESGGLQFNLLMISEEFGLTTTQMGNLVSIQYLAFILIPLIFGGYGDKYGKKIIIFLFALCFSTGCLAFLLSNGFLLVLAGAFLVGAGFSMCESAGTAVLSDVYKEEAASYINWSQSCFSAGALISPIVCQFANDKFGLGWRIFFSALLAAYVILALMALKMKFPAPVAVPKEDLKVPKTKLSSKGRILCLAFGIMISAGTEIGIAFFIGSHAKFALGTEAHNAMILSVFWITQIPSRILIGMIKKNIRTVLKLSYLFIAISIVIIAFMTTKNALVLMYGILGFVYAPLWPIIMGEAGNIDPNNSARITGIMTACCGIGGVISPTIFGVIADFLNIKASLFFVMAWALSGFVAANIYTYLSKKEK